MSSANKGAASAMSRWCSHSRPITYSNNLFAALGVHYLLAFGAGIERSVEDLFETARPQRGFLSFGLWILWYLLVTLIRLPYMSLLSIVLLINEIWRIVEQSAYILLYICTFGIFNFTRMNSVYATFFHSVEPLFGKIWHDSTIRLVTPKSPCTLCKSKGCKEGMCYKFRSRWLFDELHISCECFKRHISNRMELSRERDDCKTCFEQSDRVTQGKYLWRSSSLQKYAQNGCGIFDDDVIERHYDMERSMWVSVRLETHDRDKFSLPEVQFGRNNLDEMITVPISSPHRLFQMPQLRYSFLKSRARVEGSEDILYSPIILSKRFLSLLVGILAVRMASKTYKEEKMLAIIAISAMVALYFISTLRETVTVSDLGGIGSQVSRMLAIDALSSGSNLIKYSDAEASWSRHIGYGGTKVGKLDILENILHNRSIVMGDKMLSLSREGTSIYIADTEYLKSTNSTHSPPVMRAVKWRKSDHDEVFEATKGKVPLFSELVA